MLFPDTTAFYLGSLAVKWYGLFIMTGVIVAALLAHRLAPTKGDDPEHIWGLLPYLVVFGIIGARITYGIVRHEQFANPLELVTKFRLGGIAIQGAVIGACIAGYVYCRIKGIIFLRWADIIAPGLSLAQGIGRWGNYANQEEFGGPTKLPWGIAISPDRLEAKGLPPDVHVHPAFFYESVADVGIAAILLYLFTRVMRPRRWRDGDIFGWYGILYGITRFFTESLRIDRAMIGPLPGAYWGSIFFILAGMALILVNRRRPDPNYALPLPPSSLQTVGGGDGGSDGGTLVVASGEGGNTRFTDDGDESDAGNAAPLRPRPQTRAHTGYRRAGSVTPTTPTTPARGVENARYADDNDEGDTLT